MSWSLRLRHGDLAVENNQLEAVTAEHKLIQDLRCAILERMGTDPSHPGFGSIIDGGRRNGREIESVIGRTDWPYVRLEIEADLRRIVSEYQSRQLARAKSDSLTYNKTTLTTGEVLIGISELQVRRSLDAVFIGVRLRTAAGRTISITVPLTTT